MNLIFLLLAIYFTSIEARFAFSEDPVSKDVESDFTIRKISSGYIRGRTLTTAKGVTGYVFLSVPIADPPVGSLRFKAPVPRTPWLGLLNTTDYSVSCYWNSSATSYNAADFAMDEDCLQVHIFTNRYCLESGGCSVTLYIHGGDFTYGSPIQFDKNVLIDNYNNVTRNVVFVTMNFRQAVFGVLNLNWKLDLSMDMNVGLHDIVHAMKWIKSEIRTFGGNPDKLTLMGHSGGGVVAKLLAMSPKTKNLVNQIILMSAVTDFILFHDKNQRASREAASVLGCALFGPDDNNWNVVQEVEQVLQCLRNKSAKELSGVQKMIESDFKFNYLAKDYGRNALLPDSEDVMGFEMNPIPILSGTVSKEYLKSKATVVNGVFVDQTELRYWCQKALAFAGYPEVTDKVIITCMKEYNTTSRSMYIYDDPEIYIPTRVFLENHTKRGGKCYLYEYSYPDIGGAYVRGPNQSPFTADESPHHSQELAYVVGQHVGNFTAKDEQVQFLLTQMLVDFMNHGTPKTNNRNWTEMDPTVGNYFNIDFPDPTLESPGLKPGYHQKGYDFWHVLVPRIAGPQYIPFSEDDRGPAIDPRPQLTESSGGKEYKSKDHSGLNWTIMFWVGIGIIVLLAVSHVITCCKLKTKKKEYQSI